MHSIVSFRQRLDGSDAPDVLATVTVAVDRLPDPTLEGFEAHALRDRPPVRPTTADR